MKTDELIRAVVGRHGDGAIPATPFKFFSIRYDGMARLWMVLGHWIAALGRLCAETGDRMGMARRANGWLRACVTLAGPHVISSIPTDEEATDVSNCFSLLETAGNGPTAFEAVGDLLLRWPKNGPQPFGEY